MPSPSPVLFNSRIYTLERLMGVHYIEVPKEAIQQMGGKLNIRLLCTVNQTVTFQCGMVALGDGNAYITLNAARLKQLGLKKGDEIAVALEKDTTPYGMPVPEELAELLEQDAEGVTRFQKLAPGKQRYIINYVSTVKSSQLRIERAILLIENLKKLPPGKESFRAMLGK